jgi:peptide/nickel transport system substrate-binding protein
MKHTQPIRSLKRALTVGAALGLGALVLAACGSSSPTTSSTSTSGTTATTVVPSHKTGGTVYWAMAPAVTPNYIFPFASLQYFSVANLTQFQELMFRPLYYFGPHTTTSPDFDPTTSLADPPVWSNGGKTVTITLKGWKFHDGTTVDAQSVIFWMNMMKAESANWAGTAPGADQFPQNILSYSAPQGASGLTVVFNLDHTYNPEWYLYNELSQITPMDEAWDVTSLTAKPGSGGCGTVSSGAMTGMAKATVAACTAVWTFDTDNNGTAKNTQMGADLSTFGTNPLWQAGTDGPWLIKSFDAKSGQCSFVPNTNYSGPQKPIISSFVEVPFTSEDAEFSALAAGGATAPQVGYLPFDDITSPATSPTQAGANNGQVSSTYNISEVNGWTINYFPYNFNSTKGANGVAGKVFSQLYFRQAFQTLVDQPGMIQAYDRGYGSPTYGPAPTNPPNSFATPLETSPGGPYPFSETKAATLLSANGWKVDPGGTSTCVKAGTATGDCGAGIPAGTPLSFSEVYASGSATITKIVDYEESEWSKVGISVTLSAQPFDDVLKDAVSCYPKPTPACHGWDLANWGGGWLFSPDYLPTGEEIFATGAGSNTGDYSNAMNDKLIVETNQSTSSAVFSQWVDYLAKQLPVVWQPNASSAAEIAKDLGGVQPVNALENLDPEYWYYCTSTCPAS